MLHYTTSSMIDTLKEINKILGQFPMLEYQPDPPMDQVGEGCLKVIGSYDWDVGRVPVMTFRMVFHGIDSASRIHVHEIVDEISSTNKPILTPVSNKFVLGLQCPHIGSHNQLIISVFHRQGTGLKRFSDDFNRIMWGGTLRDKYGRTLIKIRGGGKHPF